MISSTYFVVVVVFFEISEQRIHKSRTLFSVFRKRVKIQDFWIEMFEENWWSLNNSRNTQTASLVCIVKFLWADRLSSLWFNAKEFKVTLCDLLLFCVRIFKMLKRLSRCWHVLYVFRSSEILKLKKKSVSPLPQSGQQTTTNGKNISNIDTHRNNEQKLQK